MHGQKRLKQEPCRRREWHRLSFEVLDLAGMTGWHGGRCSASKVTVLGSCGASAGPATWRQWQHARWLRHQVGRRGSALSARCAAATEGGAGA
jgi:hypothetical protein